MADGSAPLLRPNGVQGSNRSAAQENHWHSLLVSRQTLVDAGINLERRIPMLAPRRQEAADAASCTCGRPACRACAKQARTLEARAAAVDVREAQANAPHWERLLYARRGLYGYLELARPPRETTRGGVTVCQDPAPSYGRDHKPEPGYGLDSKGKPNGVRYPLVSEYTTRAAIFDLVDWRKLGAESSDEIAFAAAWLGTTDGFRRVDPFWARRKRDAERRRYGDHLKRDADGRAYEQPQDLAVLLRDFPPEVHHVVSFVHKVVTHYCGPIEGRLTTWGGELARELRPTAYEVFRTCTPLLRGGKGRRSIPSLVDEILQRGFREIVAPYRRRERPPVARAGEVAARWLQRAARQAGESPRSRGEPSRPSSLVRGEHWATLPPSLVARHQARLALNLHHESCSIWDGSCALCARSK